MRARDPANFNIWVWRGVMVAVVFLVYHPAWRAEFIWDDDEHLTAHKCIVGPLGFKEIWTTAEAHYFPLVLSTFWFLNKTFGLQPLVFHLFGIALHAACAVVLWAVLRRLRIPGAWLGAALWALHPVQVESVAWVSEIINTQSGLFFLLSIWFGVDWLDAANAERGARRQYVIALVCAACALLSKPSTVGLPVVLALCAWWLHGRLRSRHAVLLVPFFILSLATSAWTIWEQKYHAGAAGHEWSRTFAERLVIAGHAIWFYLGKLVWPEPLVFIYPRWSITPVNASSFVPLVIAAIVAIWLWHHRSSGARGAVFAAGFYGAMIFPVLGFFDVYYFRYSYVADHFQYLASIGPLALIAAGAARFAQGVTRSGERLAFAVGCGVLLLGLAQRTTTHTRHFRDSDTLWRATLRYNPACYLAWTNLGVSELEQGRYPEAAEMLRKSLAIDPNGAETHYNLGMALRAQGDIAEAVQAYEAALRLKPNFEPAHVNLGNALLTIPGRLPDAIAQYEEALQLNPKNADTHSNLSIALGEVPGRLEEAIKHGETAVRLRPDSATAHHNLGVLVARVPPRVADAIAHYEAALRLNPDYASAHFNLGLVLAATGKPNQAIHAYEAVLRLDPNSAVAHNNLAAIFAQQERWPEALRHLENAVRIDPDYSDARTSLAALKAHLAQSVP